MRKTGLVVLAFAALLFAGIFWGGDRALSVEEYRALWADAFAKGFHTAEEVDALIETARKYNYNALVVEVRKMCDAYYNSNVEPKAVDVEPQTFDPLGYMIKKAHDTSGGKQLLEVHVWMVTYRSGIKGHKIPEGEPKHIMLTHPEWLSQDYDGVKVFNNREFLDQAIPGVIDHIVNVCTDIVKNYDVDGIHYDYIRYAEAKKGDDPECAWGYNPIALKRFNSLYRREGKPLPSDPEWMEFRRQQLKDFLRKVYANVKGIRWDVKMSASTITWGELEDFKKSAAYVRTLQDWVGFMEEKLLDMNCLMNYQREYQAKYKKAYRDWTKLGAKTKSGRFCLIGAGTFMNSVEDNIEQLRAARGTKGIDGLLTYSYAGNNRDRKVPREKAFEAFRDKVFTERAEIPDAPWLSKPKSGIIMGYVAAEGVKFDGAPVKIGGKTQRTDATGFYAFLDMPAGDYSVNVELDGNEPQKKQVNVRAGKVSQLNFDLKKK